MEPVTDAREEPGWLAAHAASRTDSYVMLASLLRQTPSAELLDIMRNLQWDRALPETLDDALAALRQGARDNAPVALESEFNKLFIGLGSGEMVPYASWYRGKKIQSAPLAHLRSDLIELGIVRQANCHDAEDHAGALFEIMAIISSQPGDVSPAAQARFFQRHIAPWIMTFFTDLQSAKSAAFYRIVGLFGRCFLETENTYLNRVAQTPLSKTEGGLHHEQ